MPEITIDPVVANVSPNIYNAAKNAPLSPADRNVMEQLGYAYTKGQELKKLDNATAIKQFQALSPAAQADLRYVYPNEKFTQKQKSLMGKIISGVEQEAIKVGKIAMSPLIAAYSAMGEYNKAINVPGRVAFQSTTQSQPVFSGKTWSSAYQGSDLYNQNDVNALTEKYGPETAHIAMGVVAGKTPGEIMASWKNGTIDLNLFDAYAKFLNDPKQMTSVVDEFKLARYSPGRSAARQVTGTNPNPVVKFLVNTFIGKQLPTLRGVGESEADFKKRQAADTAKYQKMISRDVDGLYQLAIDPTTYVTMGLNKLALSESKLAPLAQKLAEHIQFGDFTTQRLKQAAEAGKWEETVADVFTKPQVKGLWDNTAGPAIKQLADAGTPAERAAAKDNIRRNLPAYNDPVALKSLVKAKVFDAESAKNYFTHWENANKLIAGRTDNTSWFRNGIATARNQRQLTQGLALAAESFFNPVVGRSSVRKTIEEADAAGADKFKILSTLGERIDNYANPELADISLYDKDITLAQKIGFKLGNLARQSQGNGMILLGEDAWRTAKAFYLRACTVMPSDQAKVVTDIFVHAPFDEQFNVARALYHASMARRGVEGIQGGKAFIEKALGKMLNLESGFGISPDLEMSHELANAAGANVVHWENDVPKIRNLSAIHPSQLTTALAPLNDVAVQNFISMNRRDKSIPALFDRTVNGKFLQAYTNGWSFLNLFPRLGMRTTLDHVTFFLDTAPKEDLIRYLMGGARREGKYLNMVTGSKDSVGPAKRIIHKLFMHGGPEDFLTAEKRTEIVNQLIKEQGDRIGRDVSIEEIPREMIRAHIATYAHQFFFGAYDSPFVTKEMLKEKEFLINMMKYDTHMLDAQVSSLTARASMTGNFTEEAARAPIFTDSALDKALKDKNEVYKKEFPRKREMEFSKNYRAVTARELRKIAGNDDLLGLAHLQGYTIRFVHNHVKIPLGNDLSYVFSPIDAFFNNDALREVRNFDNAVGQLMRHVGVNYSNPIDYIIQDAKKLNNFVKMWPVLYTTMKNEGKSEVDIADTIIKTMLIDMKYTFHGNTVNFNQKLFDAIAAEHDALAAKETIDKPIYDKWSKAAGTIDLDKFIDLTSGQHPEVLNTSLVIPKWLEDDMRDVEGWMSQWGYKAYEQMDRQVNGWFTQPALTTVGLRVWKTNYPFMEGFIKDQERLLKGAHPGWSKERIAETAKEIGEKRFTSIALNDASNTLLKYIDNQAVRSNFSIAFRTVGRYYRANEDFMRRVYRMVKDKPLKSLYRMRLLHTGIDAYGGDYKDENGKDYIIFPSDTIFNHAVAPMLNAIAGADDAYTIPQYNNIKMKLELVNPSFSQDAGALTLSSPAGSVAVLLAKGVIGIRSFRGQQVPGAAVRETVGDDMAQLFLGTTAKNLSSNPQQAWTNAIVPMLMSNFFNSFNQSDANQQFTSAAVSAASYFQAYGHGTPEPSDPQYYAKMAKIQRDMRIAAGNILFMRFLVGMGPVSGSLQESKGLPDYLREGGNTTLRGEYFKILQGIKDTYGTSVQDPYALATAIFIGKNPGKSIFTISRSSKAYSVIVQNTQEVKNWALNNDAFIKTYKDAAWVFSPQAGKFNSTVYSWMQSQDLINIQTLDTYLGNVAINNDRNAYFEIGKREQEQLAKTQDLGLRKNIIDAATADRQTLLASNPLLKTYLTNKVSARGGDMDIYNQIKNIVVDKSSPISKNDRTVMGQAIGLMDSYLNVVTPSPNNEYSKMDNYAEMKIQVRNQVEGELIKLANLSPAVSQAYDFVFKSIMNSYQPDKAQVAKRG